ncbi:MAG: hypothetical protein JXR97_15215, partial [Planctomycetes bacterium]|nr:hypothetical protein [Planctomycetota bacterium]
TAFIFLSIIIFARPALEAQRAAGIYTDELALAALSSALLSTLLSPGAELLLSLFQTWKNERQNFGIPARS